MDRVVLVVLLLLLHGGLGAAVAYGLYRLVPRKTSQSSWIAWGVVLGPILMCPCYLFGNPSLGRQELCPACGGWSKANDRFCRACSRPLPD
jgi:hypothetical protein